MKLKKVLSLVLCAAMITGMTAGCGSTKDDSSNDKGEVYYLSFKPELTKQWEDIAKKYEQKTGVKVKVVTAASGQYEQTLKSEIAKKDAPTLFQINGPVGYQNWKDYCVDLKDTDLYSWLRDKDMAVKDGDGVYGIPYVVEGYGIIYNQAIMNKYFALSGAKAASMDEINNYEKLSAVVKDMQSRKAELGIDGVFASTSFAPGEDWRWQTHLMNLPIYYEYKDADKADMKEIEFSYADNYRDIFDLYVQNSCTEPALLGSKSVENSMSEFALGKVAMVQNGNWGWGQINETEGNVVKETDVKFLPIYTGVKGEEKQGLCIGTENFFSFNKEASKEDQKASIAFVEWLFNSDEGKDIVTNTLNFISPFSTFADSENPTDPLAKEIIRYMSDSDKYSVSWNFTSFPSQTFKDQMGANLLQYATGKKEWKDVVSTTIKDWKTEKAAIQ
ncbi:MAG: carbohydrate ABC transporter substrate-binding protein [Lachnospiraceae bacterium]|nr:carbohydrate ABC transporter substrate-binding protein [Lachnospiraceae bacterium]